MVDDDGKLTNARMVYVLAETADGPAFAAVRAAAALHAAPVAWGEAAERIEQQIAPAAVLLVCDGLDDAAIAERLPTIVAAARDAGVRLIVGFSARQIDVVAGELLASEAVLLCEPTVVDWATALALAVADPDLTLRETADEDRYRRLSEEVARIADMLARITGADGKPTPTSDRPPFVAEQAVTFGARPTEVEPATIRRAIRARRLRDDVFGAEGLFEDPAWDMLLDLFAAELERRRVSVSSLCIAAAVAPTTALRWISKLMEAQLLERRPDPADRRRAFVSLTAGGSTAMRNYLAALSRAGLALA